jgi:AbrB family looped-hinge helix DNA binding protein
MKSEAIQIDKAGRIVLPKPLREHFNIVPGDKLRLSADATGFRLEPMDAAGKLVRKGSILVFRGDFGEPITNELVEEIISEDRERAANKPERKIRRK